MGLCKLLPRMVVTAGVAFGTIMTWSLGDSLAGTPPTGGFVVLNAKQNYMSAEQILDEIRRFPPEQAADRLAKIINDMGAKGAVIAADVLDMIPTDLAAETMCRLTTKQAGEVLGELSHNNNGKVDAILAAMPIKQSLPTRFAVMSTLGRTSGRYYDQSPEQILAELNGMSPGEIASILAGLDFDYIPKEAEVLSLMPPEEAAAILGRMGSYTAEHILERMPNKEAVVAAMSSR